MAIVSSVSINSVQLSITAGNDSISRETDLAITNDILKLTEHLFTIASHESPETEE